MTPFRAWYAPPGFSVGPEEVAQGAVVLDGPGGVEGPGYEYAALPEPRLLEVMGILRRAWSAGIADIRLSRVVEAVDRVAGRLLEPGDRLREEALLAVEAFSGFSPPMAEAVLDGMARSWMREGVWDLIRSEFPDPGVLDGFCPGPAGDETRAAGFPLTFHLGAGTVPGVATTSLIRSLLVGSSVILKPGEGDIPLPVLFAQGLEEEDPELAKRIAVFYWPVNESGRTETVLNAADLAVVYGGDETVRWVRERLPPHVPLRAYRHRMGFGLVGRGALSSDDEGSAGGRSSARAAALSVAIFDQRGCVSPHVFLVETGGEVTPEEWAVNLGTALEEVERTLPSGSLTLEEGAAIQQLRGAAELAESMGEGTVLHGGKDGSWTVRFVPGGTVAPSCLGRTVRVIPVQDMEESLETLKAWMPYLQTVGMAGLDDRLPVLAEALARMGVSRITPLVGMPWPRSWWHHDGSGPLRDLVRWTDVEGGGTVS
ncbi:MAG: hypothetical protein HKO65_00910 [Gemmatimonadetes bacterium]|nr:hypothetical protein [Gemmatimonadota bacterium]NNM03632.1 hypothetical protein [Gemmatimonadota bacterium]